jgi:hypothetical protein
MAKAGTNRTTASPKKIKSGRPTAETAKPIKPAPRTREENVTLCRSCGKRPGKPTAILGQMMQAELCVECAALRKERIRINRAAARAFRNGALR